MNEKAAEPTRSIEIGCASLNGLESIQVIEGLKWYEDKKWWTVKCRLTIQSADTSLVPHETDWYAAVQETYPRGEVELIPAKERSITKTFPHQYYNSHGSPDTPWRNGIICAKTALSWLKRSGYDIEPFEPESRLKWHLEQALKWLEDAASGTLIKDGELFELPDYNFTNNAYSIIFCESNETFDIWRPLLNRSGVIELGLLKQPTNTLVTTCFKDHRGQLIYQLPWNEHIENRISTTQIGTWALLPQIIALPPWQAPMTWGELRNALDNQNVNYSRMIARVAKFPRDGIQRFLMLGFPVSGKAGAPPTQIHWQALLLPVLSHGGVTANGFRTNELGYLMNDRRILSGNESLNWQNSQNWHPNEILNRGRYRADIAKAKVAIIGGGAFGSAISEMLVRGGVKDICIIDDGKMEIGNLTRHTLTLDSIGELKTEALKTRLMGISPYVRIHAYHNRLERLGSTDIDNIKDAGVVIDCTGNDDVLYYLEQFPWDRRPVFCSISIGLQARRLYVLLSQGKRFPVRFYIDHIGKWLQKDLREYDGEELPQSGGIGCWHPAFPARVDEINLFASTALKCLSNYFNSNSKYSRLAIFEQMNNTSSFYGINLVAEESDNG